MRSPFGRQAQRKSTSVDRVLGQLDTLPMIYAPLNLIFYAVGFVFFGALVATCFKLLTPVASGVDSGAEWPSQQLGGPIVL